jgi:cytochrome c-type biogenesis protein CcmE
MRKKQRVMMLVFGGVALTMSTILVSVAMRDSIVFFFGPSELLAKQEAGEITPDRRLRVGGMVVEGSLIRGEGETIRFDVTDFEETVQVTFTGIPPSLFKEGEGVVAEGSYVNGLFVASEVLAKHDEKYVPREVKDILKDDAKDGSYTYSPAS